MRRILDILYTFKLSGPLWSSLLFDFSKFVVVVGTLPDASEQDEHVDAPSEGECYSQDSSQL